MKKSLTILLGAALLMGGGTLGMLRTQCMN